MDDDDKQPLDVTIALISFFGFGFVFLLLIVISMFLADPRQLFLPIMLSLLFCGLSVPVYLIGVGIQSLVLWIRTRRGRAWKEARDA